MVYISSDGSIGKKPQSRNPLIIAKNRVFSTSPQTAAIVVGFALLCSKISTSMFEFGPLANGKIPAASRPPHEHWSYIADDLGFVRTMTKPLQGKTKATTKAGKKRLQEAELYKFINRVDFGGPDGHVAESTDFMDLENIRVTRCSTSRSAITAYMCGAETAVDSDAAHGYDAKVPNFGTRSFRDYLKCRYEQGKENGTHRRSVYRLGIGNKDNLSGYSHAFSIVAQPNGSFYWMQSFIGHYSLATWMKKEDSTNESGLAGVLEFDELMEKLHRIDRLMKIDGWTSEANNDYLKLFNVDKKLEKINSRRVQKQVWKPDHRLSQFTWDEACEYPLPEGYKLNGKSDEDTAEHEDNSSFSDQCSSMLLSNLLNDLKRGTGDLSSLLKEA